MAHHGRSAFQQAQQPSTKRRSSAMSDVSPTLFEIEQILANGLHLPVVDITLTVTRFRNLLEFPFKGSPLTEHVATMGEERGSVSLKEGRDENNRPTQIIQVRN